MGFAHFQRLFLEPWGLDPFNQHFLAEVGKFIGGTWIATGPEGIASFHSLEFRAHLKWRMSEVLFECIAPWMSVKDSTTGSDHMVIPEV